MARVGGKDAGGRREKSSRAICSLGGSLAEGAQWPPVNPRRTRIPPAAEEGEGEGERGVCADGIGGGEEERRGGNARLGGGVEGGSGAAAEGELEVRAGKDARGGELREGEVRAARRFRPGIRREDPRQEARPRSQDRRPSEYYFPGEDDWSSTDCT